MNSTADMFYSPFYFCVDSRQPASGNHVQINCFLFFVIKLVTTNYRKKR